VAAEHLLRLYTDHLAPGQHSELLGPCARVIYVAEGTAIVRGSGAAASLAVNTAWQANVSVTVTAGPNGAGLLRWELGTDSEPALLKGADIRSELSLEGKPLIQPGSEYLMRCDRVDFPPGGQALTHTHQGSGIRCLQSGRIRIDTHGHSTWIDPGIAWFESGPDEVFAETWQDSSSHFVRVMILPRSLLGKSSIKYVRPEDKDKPKSQKYQVFLDEPIALD
jgi:hypothetical protein